MKAILSELKTLEQVYCDSDDCDCHYRLDDLINLVKNIVTKLMDMENDK